MEHEHRFTERFHRDGKLHRTCGECRYTELDPVQPPARPPVKPSKDPK